MNSNIHNSHRGFTMVPNTILKAANLSSDSKVVMALLIGVYNAAVSTNTLSKDGSIYYSNDLFGMQMELSGDHIVSKVIPELVKNGLLETSVQYKGGKTLKRYILNWGVINSFDGTEKDPEKQAARVERATKGYEARKAKEAIILEDNKAAFKEMMKQFSVASLRETFISGFVKQYGYKESEARRLVDKIIGEIKEEQINVAPAIIPEASNGRVVFEDGTAIKDCFDDDDDDDDEELLF